MHLKRLKLQGYKSFAAQMEFEFNAGATAIVGPNGSGKSNIADAVRWALGEQSLSLLRAKRTEDMIFSGGPQRARLGMAQVSLTLDNADGWLPGPHEDDPMPDDALSRSSRTCSSSFILHPSSFRGGSPSRDSVSEEALSPAELLLRTNPSEITITRRAYRSGESEYLLNGSRVRRRDVIELLAKGGLHRSTYTVIGQGLVDAALSLRPEERRHLLDEAAGIHLYQAQRDEALAKLKETQSNLLRLNDILNEIAPRLARLEKRAQRAQEHARLSQELEGLLRTWYGYQWQQGQARLRAARARKADLRDALAGHQARWRELNERLAQLRLAQEERQRELAAWRREEAGLRDRREEMRRELAVSQERARLLTTQREELVREVTLLEARQGELWARLAEGDAELVALEEKREALLAQVETAREELKEAESRRRELSEKLALAQEQAFQLATHLADRRNRLAQLAERRKTLEHEREEGRQAIAALQAQMASLAEEKPPSRRWRRLETVLRGEGQLTGIIGTVANMIQATPELKRAIEAALGPYLQAIVVERWEDAERAIEFLKRTGGGKATFLPLESIRGTEGTEGTDGTRGVIGLAYEEVDFEERYADLFAALLGRTLIVQDLAAARRLAPQFSSFRLVTLDGDVMEPSGAISGGSTEELLEQQRQAERLRREIEWRRAIEARLTADMDALDEEERKLEDEVSEKGEAYTLALAALESLKAHAADGEWPALQHQLADLEKEVALRDRDRASRQATLESQRAELDRLAAQVAAKRKHAAELESETAKLSQRLEELTRQEGDLSPTLDDLVTRLSLAEESWGALAREGRELEREAAQGRDLLQAAEARHSQAVLAVERAEDKLNNLQKQLEADWEVLAPSLPCTCRPESLGLRTKGPRQVPRQLPLDFAELAPLPTFAELPAGLERQVQQLKGQLRGLGSVDPEALAEYEETLERHSFLAAQVDDLQQAVQDLQQVIAKLDRLMAQRFGETFSAVAETFGDTFTTLFGGGTAQLVLTESENPTEAGVDIVARPPGKRAQSLALLSGGERAITAAALIFALLKVSPTPFCLLDEVDATLDEANIRRFRDVLQDLSRDTQFIVITHNRGTIEIAEAIYGIAMGSDGASQVISLKLDEIAA
jgi:chromosome segregation protein